MAPVEAWRIPYAAITESMREMAIDGLKGDEGTAFWLGHHDGRCAVVTHVALLRGRGIKKRPDQLVISSDLMNDLTNAAIDEDVTLLGQIHSHSPRCTVDLSYADHTYGVRVPYFLSVVAPDFAQRTVTALTDCGVHIFEPGHGFRRISLKDIQMRIEIIPAAVKTLIIGQEDS